MAEPYALEPDSPRPDLPGTTIVRENLEELIDPLAADLLTQALSCVRAFGDHHLGISSGRGIEVVLRRFMYDPALRAMPWTRTHLWLVGDDASEGGASMLRDWVVDHAGIPDEQVHSIPFDSDRPAATYVESMRTEFAWREKGHERLDSVLLPLTPDGRLGGIRPCSPAIEERIEPVVDDGERVTMTLTMLNASRFIAVLGTGEDVQGVIERLVDRRTTSLEVPAAGLEPLAGELRWYLDEEACAFLRSV